eukprot:scaffold345_cov104-Isochrysis_galbana.AAC.17
MPMPIADRRSSSNEIAESPRDDASQEKRKMSVEVEIGEAMPAPRAYRAHRQPHPTPLPPSSSCLTDHSRTIRSLGHTVSQPATGQ